MQRFPADRYEVVVIDDNSTDDTAAVVAAMSASHPQVRCVPSRGRGLLHARVTGQQVVAGQYIAYLDDDARACDDWLLRASAIIREQRPVCFGGPFFPFYTSKKPGWYRDEYGSFSQGAIARELTADEYLCGGNIFFEAEALRASGGFDPNYCAPGDRWTYGDENVPQNRLRRICPARHFLYDPELFIRHLVRPARLNLVQAARECFAMGRAYVKSTDVPTSQTRLFPYVWRFARSYLAFWWSALVKVWFRDRRQFVYPQNYIYEAGFQELRRAALFYETIRVIRQRRFTKTAA